MRKDSGKATTTATPPSAILATKQAHENVADESTTCANGGIDIMNTINLVSLYEDTED